MGPRGSVMESGVGGVPEGFGRVIGVLGGVSREILVSEVGGLGTSWRGFWGRYWGPGGVLREVLVEGLGAWEVLLGSWGSSGAY